jgi:hypothetical protein
VEGTKRRDYFEILLETGCRFEQIASEQKENGKFDRRNVYKVGERIVWGHYERRSGIGSFFFGGSLGILSGIWYIQL